MRLANRLLVLALGLSLLVGGAIVAIEVAFGGLGGPRFVIPRARWDDQLAGLRWGDSALTLVFVALTAGGLFLAIAQLVPQSPRSLEVAAGPRERVAIRRRGLEARLQAVAADHPDVTRATVRVDLRRAMVRAAVPRGVDRPSLERHLTAALSGELAAWGLGGDRGPRLRISVAPARHPEARR